MKRRLSGSPFLRDAWVAVLQLPGSPKEGVWGGKDLWAQPRAGLAGQRVAGLFLGRSRGDEL